MRCTWVVGVTWGEAKACVRGMSSIVYRRRKSTASWSTDATGRLRGGMGPCVGQSQASHTQMSHAVNPTPHTRLRSRAIEAAHKPHLHMMWPQCVPWQHLAPRTRARRPSPASLLSPPPPLVPQPRCSAPCEWGESTSFPHDHYVEARLLEDLEAEGVLLDPPSDGMIQDTRGGRWSSQLTWRTLLAM